MIKYSNKKAMTMPEVLIALGVIGTLMMMFIPVIIKNNPISNQEKFLYKKAINTMQNAISSIMNEYEVVNSSNYLKELSQSGVDLRAELASKMKTRGSVNTGTSAGTASNPDFYTEDQMIWWNIPQTWDDNKDYIDVKVDLNGTGGNNLETDDEAASETNKPDIFKIRIMKDGRVVVPEIGSTEGDWTFEMKYLTTQGVTK